MKIIVISSILAEARSQYAKDESFLRSFSSSSFDDDFTETDFTETDCLTTVIDANVSLNNIIEIKKYSTLKKLIAVTASILRFINNIQSKINKRRSPETITPEEEEDIIISAEEQETALKKWILEEQSILSRSHQFTKQFSSLGLYSDDGILRLRSRFKNSAMMENQKHPILIRDATSTFTKMIIWDSHEKMMHQGVEAILASVRRRF